MIAALGFFGSVFLSGIGVLRYSHPRYYAYPDTPEGRQQAHETYLRTGDRAILAVYASAGACLLLLFAGIAYAYGLAPNFLARRVRSTRVEERLKLYRDGSLVCGDNQDGEGRRYLRLRLPDGSVSEFSCGADVFRRSAIGAFGDAWVVGRRLERFERDSGEIVEQ